MHSSDNGYVIEKVIYNSTTRVSDKPSALALVTNYLNLLLELTRRNQRMLFKKNLFFFKNTN